MSVNTWIVSINFLPVCCAWNGVFFLGNMTWILIIFCVLPALLFPLDLGLSLFVIDLACSKDYFSMIEEVVLNSPFRGRGRVL